MASARDQALSINLVMNSAINGANFLQVSVNKLHKYAKTVEKIDLLKQTKFPLLKKNLNSLENHLGKIRSVSAKISANPIKLDVKSSGNTLKEARKDMTAIQHDAKQFAFFTRKANENLNKPVRAWNQNPAGGSRSPQTRTEKVKKAVKDKVKTRVAVAGAGAVGTVMALNPVRKAIDFESSMADVVKATNATKPQALVLKNNILKQVQKGSLLAPTQIAQIQAGGGRSGVAIKALPRFTADIAKASVAMDLSTEESGRQFAKMAERLDLPINKINIMTNAFTHLENNGANSARDMINTTGRLAGVFKELDFKPKNAGAISNYMNTLEVSPELAATSFKILTNRLKKTNSEFGYFDKLKNEGAGSLKSIIMDISTRMNSEEIINKFGSQGANVITKMSGDYKNLDKSLSLVKGTAFMKAVDQEYKIKVSTTGAKETMAQNRITGQGIVAGDELKKPYIEMYEAISMGLSKTISFYKENKEAIHTFGSIALKVAVVAVAIKTLGMVSSPFVSLIGGAYKFRKELKIGAVLTYKATLATLSVGAKVTGGVLSFVGRSALWLGRALMANPVGLIITGIATAGYLIYKNWDYLKKTAGAIWTSIATAIKTPFVSVFDWINKKFEGIVSFGKKAKSLLGFGSDEKEEKTKDKTLALNNPKYKNIEEPGFWNKTKNFFSFGSDEKKYKTPGVLDHKVKIEKSINNVDYKKASEFKTPGVFESKTDLKQQKVFNHLPVNNLGYKNTPELKTPGTLDIKPVAMNSSLQEINIPKLPIESVSAITDNSLTEQKMQIENKRESKQVTQHITNTIHVTATDGIIDEEAFLEQLLKAQAKLKHDDDDISMIDAS